MLLVQVSCQLDGQEEVHDIERMASRSSGGELGDGVRAKRMRSVHKGNVGEMKKVGRVMSEGRDVVAVESPGIVAEKTINQEVGEVEAVEVPQGIICKRSLGGEPGDVERRDEQHIAGGGEGSAGEVLKPVTRLLSKTMKDPRTAVVDNSVRATRSQTAPRVEKTGREGIFS